MRRLLAAALLCLALPLLAQVVMEEIGALQESYSSALQSFQSVHYPQAVESLSPLIATLQEWERSGRLQASDEALLERALELRGLCSFNLGKTSQARDDWTNLIHLRPDYPFALTRTPKILKLFEEIRSSLTGTLSLSIEPTDSQVTLDGRTLGMTSGTLAVLKGMHVLNAARQGYTPQEREISVEIGSSAQESIKLVPNSRTIFLFASPEGTQLLVDGKAVGRADRPAGSQEDWAKFARENGQDPAHIYVIPALYLPPGDHRVALVCPCYRRRDFVLTVVLDRANNSPGYVKPIALERRTVNLEIVSHPAGASVTLDGEEVGSTPVHLADFCIGPHDLLIQKPGAGLYRSSIVVKEGPVFKVEATLRPTLLWVGLTRDQDATARQQEAASEALREAITSSALSHFNATVAQENNPVLPDTFFTPGVGAQDQAAAVKELCEKYRCEGLLAGRLSKADGQLTMSLRLFVPGLAGFDEAAAALKEASEAALVLGQVDRPLIERSPEVLLSLADLPDAKGPVFLRGIGDAQGPAPGDVLLSVDGVKAATAAAAREAIAAHDDAVLRFLRRGEEKMWAYRPSAATVLTPFGGESFGYRRLWLKATLGVAGAESAQEQAASRLSLAYADLNLGRPEEAFRALEPLTMAATGPLDQSTVGYLRAVALVQLGRMEEAREPLKSAVLDLSASLDGLGNILVAPLAADLLRQLPPPPALPPPAGK